MRPRDQRGSTVQDSLRVWEAAGPGWRGVGQAGMLGLGMGAGVVIVEAVRFPMAKFGCDPKEGTFSVREVRIPRILALHWGWPW